MRWRFLVETASNLTEAMGDERFKVDSHDVGFKMLSSFGNGITTLQSLEQDSKAATLFSRDVESVVASYKETLISSAKSLVKRFDAKLGVIKSWDNRKNLKGAVFKFPVIIDSMMNLQLLFWAFNETRDQNFLFVATSHANATMKNHVRNDGSTYHVVDYSPNGKKIVKLTHQGFADNSTWSRGQSWAIYGFTNCYRATGNLDYLLVAVRLAEFVLQHPRFPKGGGVPPWDFNDDDPLALRDASAAAILAAGLLHLSSVLMPLTSTTNAKFQRNAAQNYRSVADQILKTLSSLTYLAEPRHNRGFLLLHSVGQAPQRKELDAPLIYTDFYFVEALGLSQSFEN